MIIGIIGTGISGLIAGKKLAEAGHDVTMVERNSSLGGLLSTIKMDQLNLDYGITHFEAKTHTFKNFVTELKSVGVTKEWTDAFSLYDGLETFETNPHADSQPKFVGTNGMQSIAEKMTRLMDFKAEEQAGGLTYIGPDRSKKRSWMINLTDISVFECDAVIIATSALEAYGVLQTTQNKTATRKIIRHIDEVQYDGCISLAATFDHEIPDWEGIECEHSSIKWISNEASKQDTAKAGVVIQSSPQFFRKHARTDENKVTELLLEEASEIVDPWLLQPKSTHLHRWKYFKARNPINEYFMELEMEGAPLALIGDYLGGNSLENAFVSGYNLAEYWIKKYDTVTA